MSTDPKLLPPVLRVVESKRVGRVDSRKFDRVGIRFVLTENSVLYEGVELVAVKRGDILLVERSARDSDDLRNSCFYADRYLMILEIHIDGPTDSIIYIQLVLT